MSDKPRVLVAEDDATTRMTLEKILGGWGYEIDVAQDGSETWAKAKTGDYSIVLLDWLMPEIDGVSLCKRIRNHPFDNYIYIILLTVMTKTEDVILGLDAGADDYIKKPFEAGELRSRLKVGERTLGLETRLKDQLKDLEDKMDEVRQLKQLIPICSYCKKVRDDKDYWQQLEDYIAEMTGSHFTHGICPDCKDKVIDGSMDEAKPKG